MTNILDAARLRAFAGTPVFPLAIDKRPCCTGWQAAATADPDALARLFADPRAVLIGMPTGAASGFDILDIDPAKGGLEWWEANKHRIPPARIQHTRSGGLHVPFQHAPGLRNSASRIAPGVDIRAEGGYVADWGSAGLFAEGTGLPAWPDWLLIELMRRQTRAVSAPAPADLAPPSAADLAALLRAMPNPAETTRDDYVALNLSVQGCLRALDALDKCDPNDADDIRDAAAEWCARWGFRSRRRRGNRTRAMG